MGNLALETQHLAHLHPSQRGQIACQSRRGGEGAHFEPAALGATRARRREALAGWGLVKEQRHLCQERGLITLDDEEKVALSLPDLLAERALAVERITGHQSSA